MALKYLIAEQQATQYFFRVLMDDTKVNVDGSPIQDYVREYSWMLTPPNGQDVNAYLANIKNEIQGLVNYELQQMQIPQVPQAPIALSGF